MRWAGWWAMSFLVVACGGAPPSGTSDAGGGAITSPDAGIPGTDAGTPADCAGLLPAGPGGAVTFDVPTNPGDACIGSLADGQGVVAAGVQPAAGPRRWVEYGAPYGSAQGTFESPWILPQPKGFMGLFVDSNSQATVMLWDSGGGIVGTPTPIGNAGSVVLGPTLDAGVISLFAGPTTLTVRKHDAEAGEMASTTVNGAFTPRAVVEDASGAILAVTGSGTALSGFWVDLVKNTSGPPFSIGTGAAVLLRPLLGGGIAVQIDGAWAGATQPGDAALRAPPAWLGTASDFVPIRAGKAYALIRPAGSVGVVSAQGSACGGLTFPGVTSVSIGLDGSAVGSTGSSGCTRYLWRNVLR